MAEGQPQTIAIVGMGFSGTATAVHLLRAAAGRRLRLILIERAAEPGRGVAYARGEHPYLLNVPASRMSATTADPREFLRFAQQHVLGVDGEAFLPRTLYGDYMQGLLRAAISESRPGIEVAQLRGEVAKLSVDTSNNITTLGLLDGRTTEAHHVVFALGNPPPCLPSGISCRAGGAANNLNPWSEAALYDGKGPLLIIGTGLTMADIVTASLEKNPDLTIHAISRHGLIPPSQSTFRPDALDGDEGLLAASAGSIRRLVAAARRLGNEALTRGGDWREVVTLLRRQAPALWAALSTSERARFLRHVRTYWDIHRHRIPARTVAILKDAQVTGRLFVHAGRLRELHEAHDGIRASWAIRGSQRVRTLEVAKVINCTGPDYNISRSPEPLWRSLLASGLARPDELSLGIRTGRSGALVRRDDSISPSHYYIGPMLRADHWEATAVGELRTHAEQLAEHLTTKLS
jgi:uncharacterized NAD(P)/FAD-binding protein YdhS